MALQRSMILLLLLGVSSVFLWGQSSVREHQGTRRGFIEPRPGFIGSGTPTTIPYDASLPISQGMNIEIEYTVDSAAGFVDIASVRKAAEEGITAAGWSKNSSSQYLLAIGISTQRSPAGIMFQIQATSGVNTTADELLRSLGPNQDVKKNVFLSGSNAGPVIDAVRLMAQKAGRLSLRHIQGKHKRPTPDDDDGRFYNQQ